MFDQAARAVLRVTVFGGGIDAEGVIDRGNHIIRMNLITLRVRPMFVGFAVDLVRPNATTGDEATVASRPVIATAGADIVGRRRAELGRAAEFAYGQH